MQLKGISQLKTDRVRLTHSIEQDVFTDCLLSTWWSGNQTKNPSQAGHTTSLFCSNNKNNNSNNSYSVIHYFVPGLGLHSYNIISNNKTIKWGLPWWTSG